MLGVVHRQFAPSRVLLLLDTTAPAEQLPGWLPELTATTRQDGRATAYVCQNHTCRLPIHDAAELAQELKAESR
jgi:uncharacterized protein YyaL (SSP411 family)